MTTDARKQLERKYPVICEPTIETSGTMYGTYVRCSCGNHFAYSQDQVQCLKCLRLFPMSELRGHRSTKSSTAKVRCNIAKYFPTGVKLPTVKLRRLLPEAQKPTKATSGSAYYDLYSAESYVIKPGQVCIVRTGWLVEVSQGYFLDVRPRGGLASKGLTINNSPGTVDTDYRGELLVIMINHSNGDFLVSKGDRIAQCALMPVVECNFVLRGRLSTTKRGSGALGSTGK